ncbi:hypothetical protein NG831_18675 [Xanthomonas sacchari]|nr:hypothetical protein [Xanthomonas sacchari]UYK66126.1 hypothetical protein NG831_18675 [Xanthomonas sacchari]
MDILIAFLAILIALAPSAQLVYALRHVGMQEDAMIGLRHLRNMLEGHGLVYNVGYSALGVTDPLFWLASSVIVKPLMVLTGGQDVLALHYLACVIFNVAAMVILVYRAPRHTRTLTAVVLAVCSVFFFWPLRFLYLGLEGSFLLLSVAVLAWMAGALSQARSYLMAGIAAVLAWNRPEIAVVAFLSVVPYLLLQRGRRQVLRDVAAYAVGVATVPILFWMISGRLVPGTVAAKAYFGAPSSPLTFDAIVNRFDYLDAFIGMGAGVSVALLSLVGIIALADAFIFFKQGRNSVPWRSGVYSLFVAGYSCFILLIPSLWEWYVSFWLAFVLVLLSRLVVTAILWMRAEDVGAARRTTVFAFCVLALCWLAVPRTEAKRAEIISWIQQDAGFRGRLSHELNDRWHAKSVWMEAAGWQGSFNDAHVFDEVGLVDESALARAHDYGCRYFVRSLQDLKPQFVIKRRFEVEKNTMVTPPKSCPGAPLFSTREDRAWFFDNYDRVETYETPSPGYFGEYSVLDLYRLKR